VLLLIICEHFYNKVLDGQCMKISSFCGCRCGCVGVAKSKDIVYFTNSTLPEPRYYIPFEKALWDQIILDLKTGKTFFNIIEEMTEKNPKKYAEISSFIRFIKIRDVKYKGVHSRKLTFLDDQYKRELYFSHDELELFILGVEDNQFEFDKLPEACAKEFKLQAA